jgi:hypothetical protein
MRGILPLVLLAGSGLGWLGLSWWSTCVLNREPDLPRLQRIAQLVVVWVVPFVGALLVSELHRPPKQRRLTSSLNADQINPTVNQALQPLANGETRAAIGFVEQETFGAVVENIGHDSGGDAGGSH